jgi:phosphoribosylanthranilate isomerase
MHLRVKICGVTRVADALAAVELGADAIGLNFHPPSPRCVGSATATAIVRALPPFVEVVAVFVEQPPALVRELLRDLGPIRTVQLHGRHREEDDYAPFRFIPAFAVRDEAGIAAVERSLETWRQLGRLPSAVLVDGHAPGQHGGTGRTAPWELVAVFRPQVPLVLAGGLTPANVAEAVAAVRPYAVDVASGVEAAPGQKDRDKMRHFIDNARAAVRLVP